MDAASFSLILMSADVNLPESSFLSASSEATELLLPAAARNISAPSAPFSIRPEVSVAARDRYTIN